MKALQIIGAGQFQIARYGRDDRHSIAPCPRDYAA